MQNNDALLARRNRKLLQWFDQNKRDLPFRKKRNPYRIWVSEIMLQQTRVEAMLERYKTFVKKFPNVSALSEATEEEVVASWQGLGYYSRAKNLHRAARKIAEDSNGEMPGSFQELLLLPGVGPYTAAAVSSIAFGERVPVLDGNVNRVVSRWLALDVASPAKGEIDLFLRRAIDYTNGRHPGDWNEALMELGALVCTPGVPSCEICQLQSECQAFSNGGKEYAATIPAKKKQEFTSLLLQCFIVKRGGEFVMEKDKKSLFFKNQFAFPMRVLDMEKRVVFESKFLKGKPFKETAKQIPGSFRHSITRYKLSVEVYFVESAGAIFGEPEEVLFFKEAEKERVLYSSFSRKAWSIFDKFKTVS